jgi:lysophospholipase L1-like esterase
MIKNVKALLFGLAVALVLCEIVLRIYNPFTNFTKQGKLILPAHQKTVFENKWIAQLDPEINYSRNSLGFRGPEPADSIHKLNSIICIGGSTTECRFLSDDQTWPYLLQQKLKDSVPDLWINNAGIDGHSTFGHLLLLKEYILKLKPKYVLLLTGVNDVETQKPESFDEMNENKIHFTSIKSFLKSVLNKTEIGATVFQFYAIKLAYKKGLIHKEVDFKNLPDTLLPPAYMQQQLELQQPFLNAYQKRLQEIINLCSANNIKTILLTQPSLYGAYTDPATGIKMDTKYYPVDAIIRNNVLQEQVLESYNNVVRSFATQTPVIDLARLMPKSTALYYDFIHFNNKGAETVAFLLSNELKQIVK